MLINFYRLMLLMLARLQWNRSKECVICGKNVKKFLPYRLSSHSSPQLMIALEGIGSDVDHFECPWCGCHDRERHLLMYMKATGLFESLSNKAVLHFAPERRLSPLITAKKPLQYIRCDLHPKTPEIEKIDILEIPYAAENFDLVIANHVLEHVADDLAALAEIYRVLKAGGYAILQTPYSAKLHHTWSDPGIDTNNARLQAYGQEDHVRLFGRDIFERFTSVGLESCVSTHDQLLPQHDPNKYGVNGREPFFLFRRSA